MRRVRRGTLSSELLMCGGGVRSILLLPLVARCLETMILVRNASPRGPMCFRCLTLNLSGPCEMLFLLCFNASWT